MATGPTHNRNLWWGAFFAILAASFVYTAWTAAPGDRWSAQSSMTLAGIVLVMAFQELTRASKEAKQWVGYAFGAAMFGPLMTPEILHNGLSAWILVATLGALVLIVALWNARARHST